MIRLTDEELQEAGAYHSNPMSIKRSVAKAQLKKVREALGGIYDEEDANLRSALAYFINNIDTVLEKPDKPFLE